MKRSKTVLYLVFALLLLVPTAMGQGDAEPIAPTDADMMNPEAHISFPPPVYVVRDSVDIRGTVTLETMRNFFIEFRPLVLDMMMDDEEEQENQWFPATLPRIEAVTDDVLGTWNTVTLRDGLYELRLQINTGGEEPEYYRVSPIRVENNPPPFVAEEQMAAVDEPAEDMDDEPAEDMADEPAEDMMDEPAEDMADEPEPEPTVDPRPHVIASVNANVRAGDSTAYRVIGFLLDGESALVKGISSRGSGWYYIELANGRSGFIYPFIVNTQGDFGNLPQINPPPPPPPTPVPVPTAVPPPAQPPQPQSNVDLVFGNVQVHPHGVKCNETYEIQVLVRNAGSGNAPSGGVVSVRDSGLNGTASPQTTQIAFGALVAGAQQLVTGHLTPSVHVETLHHITLQLDANNQIVEINEGNNVHATAPYWLSSGC